MKTIQLTIKDLKKIIEDAEMMKKYDSSLSDTLEINQLKECDTHTGSDLISVNIKSSYQECTSKSVKV